MIKNIKNSINNILVFIGYTWLDYTGRVEEIKPNKVDIHE